MNIRLVGAAPECAGFVFAVRDGRVTSGHAEATAHGGVGLSTGIVLSLGGTVPDGASERALEVDQTNRSIIVGNRWIVKHIDRWGTADRSARIEQALAEAGSQDVPGFLGSVEWEHPTLGASTIALVSEYVEGAADGWSWAADDVLEAVQGGRGFGADAEWPALVGKLVARVHSDLARAQISLASKPPADDTVRAGLDFTRRVAADLVEGYSLRQDLTALRMRARIPALLRAASALPADWAPVPRVTHGDLHVGQVIRTNDLRYLLLDFDGDPQWDRADGIRPEPVERDLAHMLNSIDLVAAVAQKRLGRADPALWEWASRAAQQFLSAYRAMLPEQESEVFDERALPALRAEQLLLELRYAQRYLPVWEYAPDAVISFRYPTDATEETPPWTPPNSSTT